MQRISSLLLVGALAALGSGCAEIKSTYEDLWGASKPQAGKAPIARSCQPIGNRELRHVVRKKQTLGGIAQCYQVRLGHLIRRNKISNPDHLEVGQTLIIPSLQWVRAAKSGRVVTSAAPGSGRLPKVKPLTRQQSGINWRWPTRGDVIRKFSPQAAGKKGIVISGQEGQQVIAAASGEVVYHGEGLTGYGKLLIVQHKRDFLTVYAHNSVLHVPEGTQVAAGQVIAKMGKTAAKTARLHFEVRYKGNPVNPLDYLPKR